MASTTSLTTDELRLLTWSNPELNRLSIQLQSLQRNCPLDQSRLQRDPVFGAKCTAPPSDMGDLEILPLEIIHLTFNMLDLQTLIDFRTISWRARALVDSFSPYNEIIQYCPDALRALLSTHMSVYFTAQDILQALYAESCFVCGHPGLFFDMFTSYRCCITCVSNSDSLLCVTASFAKRKLGLNSKTMSMLPTLLSIPGKYAEKEKTYQRRILLVRMLSAAVAVSIQQEDSNSSHPRPRSLGKGPIPRQLLLRLDRHRQNPYRFMAVVRLPFLDRGTGALNWGVSCRACRLGPQDYSRGYRDWNNVYSIAGYMRHFQECEVSQIGRKVMPGYIVPVGQNQCISDAKFLGFLNKFKFETPSQLFPSYRDGHGTIVSRF